MLKAMSVPVLRMCRARATAGATDSSLFVRWITDPRGCPAPRTGTCDGTTADVQGKGSRATVSERAERGWWMDLAASGFCVDIWANSYELVGGGLVDT
jgi:hypothetical protein